MNTTVAEGEALAAGILSGLPHGTGVEVVLCPPFVSLVSVAAALKDSDISIGAQNLYHEANGAYTGEISAAMLAIYVDMQWSGTQNGAAYLARQTRLSI